MTRIVAGEYGGRLLKAPSGQNTRPTSERTREALFASLQATHDLSAGPFVDLYAGSGAVGLEAISRGAPSAYFVESDGASAAAIRANIATLGAQSRCIVLQQPAEKACHSGVTDAQTVFIDPPYDDDGDDLGETLRRLLAAGLCRSEAVIVVERAHRDGWQWPDGIDALRDRRYGETHLWYGRAL